MKNLYLIFIPIIFIVIGCGEQQTEINHSEKTRSEKWIEDIAYFENEYLNESKTFPKDSISTCKLLLSTLKSQVDSLSDNQIILQLSKCVAMANNGHTTIHLSGMDKIPVRFYWFADGLYIIKADKYSAQYLGTKVLNINSIKIDFREPVIGRDIAFMLNLGEIGDRWIDIGALVHFREISGKDNHGFSVQGFLPLEIYLGIGLRHKMGGEQAIRKSVGQGPAVIDHAQHAGMLGVVAPRGPKRADLRKLLTTCGEPLGEIVVGSQATLRPGDPNQREHQLDRLVAKCERHPGEFEVRRAAAPRPMTVDPECTAPLDYQVVVGPGARITAVEDHIKQPCQRADQPCTRLDRMLHAGLLWPRTSPRGDRFVNFAVANVNNFRTMDFYSRAFDTTADHGDDYGVIATLRYLLRRCAQPLFWVTPCGPERQ